ncbi:MAG TPA: hypothetical protein VHA75_03985 [Rugosimonospora sp.]|nr:hypothetical protein [Rugosimonospora sp.]
MAATEAVPAVPARRLSRAVRFGLVLTTALALLFGVPWATLVIGGEHWPAPVVAAGTVVFVLTLAAFPALMVAGHGARHLDWAARAGDTVLGVIWVQCLAE